MGHQGSDTISTTAWHIIIFLHSTKYGIANFCACEWYSTTMELTYTLKQSNWYVLTFASTALEDVAMWVQKYLPSTTTISRRKFQSLLLCCPTTTNRSNNGTIKCINFEHGIHLITIDNCCTASITNDNSDFISPPTKIKYKWMESLVGIKQHTRVSLNGKSKMIWEVGLFPTCTLSPRGRQECSCPSIGPKKPMIPFPIWTGQDVLQTVRR